MPRLLTIGWMEALCHIDGTTQVAAPAGLASLLGILRLFFTPSRTSSKADGWPECGCSPGQARVLPASAEEGRCFADLVVQSTFGGVGHSRDPGQSGMARVKARGFPQVGGQVRRRRLSEKKKWSWSSVVARIDSGPKVVNVDRARTPPIRSSSWIPHAFRSSSHVRTLLVKRCHILLAKKVSVT